jgi:hypothetical protein
MSRENSQEDRSGVAALKLPLEEGGASGLKPLRRRFRGAAVTGLDLLDLLSTAAWDVRATLEAQLRTLTSLQRCLDEYRDSADPKALRQVAEHLHSIDARMPALRDALPQAREALQALVAGSR